jgi:phytoene dehydrogenase-like protein
MSTATIIGSGPNGLSAAIVLAASGVRTTVLERNGQIGGGCSTAGVTQPGFLHDLGSSTYPLGAVSPFYGSLPFTIPWIQPHAAFAHPLDDGTAVVLEHSIEEIIDQLDACDRKAYRSLIEPLVSNFAALVEEILGPILHIPGSPFVLARFGLSALLPALSLAPFPLCWRTGSIPLRWRLNAFHPPVGNHRFSWCWLDADSRWTHRRLADPAWRCAVSDGCPGPTFRGSGRPS